MIKLPTPKALEEIASLEAKIREAKEMRDRYIQRGWYKEANKYSNKIFKYEEKIDRIKELGLSTREANKLKKELQNFEIIEMDRDIVGRTITKVGYSKALGSYVKVKYIKYSGLLSNVRGASSLAHKIDIEYVEPISKETYERIIAGIKRKGGYKQVTSAFGGAQVSRSGKVVRKPSPRYDLLEYI